jgi:Putative adhesin
MTTTRDATLLLDHPIGKRGRVAIRLASAEVRLLAEDGDRVTVRTTDGALPDRVVIEPTDGAVTVREQEGHGLTFGIDRKSVRIEVSLPKDAEVTVDTASGEVLAEGLRGDQRYRTASGELRLLDVAGRIDVNAVSGDATLDLAGEAELGIRTVSGDVHVEGGRLGVARVNTTSGDVRLDSPLTARTGNAIETLSGDVSILATAGMKVEARTVSGDITSEVPHRTDGRMGRRTLIIGDGSIELSFRSVSGDLLIHDAAWLIDRAIPAPAPTAPPMPPTPPLPPLPGTPDDEPALSRAGGSGAPAAGGEPGDDERMRILRALETGEIDVATAMDRLATLDADGEAQEPTDG